MVARTEWCARCARLLKAGVGEDDPRHIYGPVGECRQCWDLPDVPVSGPQQSPGARLRRVRFCVLCKRGFSPQPGASEYRQAICQSCND